MLVEIRIYRRHDADIMMLKSYGVNISKLMKAVLENYVIGKRVKYQLPGSQVCDISQCTMLRYRLNIKNPDVISLLKNIKKGYRNQFCKALVRDSLEAEPLGVFFEDKDYIDDESKRLQNASENTEINLDNKKTEKTKKDDSKTQKTRAIKSEEPASTVKEKKVNQEEATDDKHPFAGLEMEETESAKETKQKKDAELMSMFKDMMSEVE